MEPKLHKELLDDHDLFNKTFLFAPIGKALVSRTGTFLKVNPSFCRFIGYSEEELLKMDFQSITYSDDLEGDISRMDQLYNGKITSYELQKRYIHKNGNVLWGLLSCSVVRNEQGNGEFHIAQIVDITNRKKAEEELAFATEYLESFIQNTSDGIAIFDLEGYIVRVNPAFERMFGWTEDEIKGKRLPVTPEKVKDDAEYLLREAKQGNVVNGYETIKQCKNGSILHVSITMSSIRNREQEIVALVGLVRDIHERKMMELKLRESQDIFKMISHNSQDVITITDGKGIVKYISPTLTTVLGYEPEEVLGKLSTSYWHPDDVVMLTHTDLLQHSDEGTYECRVRHKNGDYVPFETRVKAVRDVNGDIEQLVGIGRDMTERKRAEHYMVLSEKLSVVSQLAAGIAHEIRNPLTAIKGFIRLIKEKLTDENYYFEIMLDEIKRVEIILNELLVLSKPKGMHWEKKSIHSILSQVGALLQTQAILHNIAIVEAFEQKDIEIWCDENSLKQVFINLIKNSIEAMTNGGEIRIKTEQLNHQIVIEVIDQGCGIPPEKLKQIGTPFYTTKENGTGLGMMISFDIIENHKGQLKIESEVNKGTTFTITLPISEPLE